MAPLPSDELQSPQGHSAGPFRSSARKRRRISSQQLYTEEGEDGSCEETRVFKGSYLGLKLKVTPELINSVLKAEAERKKQSRTRSPTNHNTHSSLVRGGDSPAKAEDLGSQPPSVKRKALSFQAKLLRIGHWEWLSRNENHLMGKCYYAKKKIVWEILDGALKSKIEMQWSDILAIRAVVIDDHPGILEIELKQPPKFFKETNPQPRKHTIWHPTSDFTGGQALKCRRHFLQFPPESLKKHYQHLLESDPFLFELSQKPFPLMKSPYFHTTHGISFNYKSPPVLQVSPKLQYSSSPILPSSLVFPPPAQNLELTVQPHAVLDSNSPISVFMDFSPRNESMNSCTFGHQNAENWRTLQGNNVGYFQGRGDEFQPLPPSICPLTQAASAGIYCQANEIHAVQPSLSSPTLNGARFPRGEQIQDLTPSVSPIAGSCQGNRIHALAASSIPSMTQDMAGFSCQGYQIPGYPIHDSRSQMIKNVENQLFDHSELNSHLLDEVLIRSLPVKISEENQVVDLLA